MSFNAQHINFHEPVYLVFLLLPLPLESYPGNHYQVQCKISFCLFSSKKYALGLTLRSVIHLEFIFVKGSNFELLHVDIQGFFFI